MTSSAVEAEMPTNYLGSQGPQRATQITWDLKEVWSRILKNVSAGRALQ